MTSLAEIPAFASLDHDDLAQLAALTRPVSYSAGAVIRPAGTAPRAVVLLLTGMVVAAHNGPSGAQLWPQRWMGPAIVDKPAVLGGQASSGALLAVTPCDGLRLHSDHFVRLLDEHEPVRRHVVRRLAADALAQRERWAEAATLPVAARVARFMLDCGAWHGSQEDLARTLGLSRVTVNRVLGTLSRVGAVRLTPGGVRVADRARLGGYGCCPRQPSRA